MAGGGEVKTGNKEETKFQLEGKELTQKLLSDQEQLLDKFSNSEFKKRAEEEYGELKNKLNDNISQIKSTTVASLDDFKKELEGLHKVDTKEFAADLSAMSNIEKTNPGNKDIAKQVINGSSGFSTFRSKLAKGGFLNGLEEGMYSIFNNPQNFIDFLDQYSQNTGSKFKMPFDQSSARDFVKLYRGGVPVSKNETNKTGIKGEEARNATVQNDKTLETKDGGSEVQESKEGNENNNVFQKMDGILIELGDEKQLANMGKDQINIQMKKLIKMFMVLKGNLDGSKQMKRKLFGYYKRIGKLKKDLTLYAGKLKKKEEKIIKEEKEKQGEEKEKQEEEKEKQEEEKKKQEEVEKKNGTLIETTEEDLNEAKNKHIQTIKDVKKYEKISGGLKDLKKIISLDLSLIDKKIQTALGNSKKIKLLLESAFGEENKTELLKKADSILNPEALESLSDLRLFFSPTKIGELLRKVVDKEKSENKGTGSTEVQQNSQNVGRGPDVKEPNGKEVQPQRVESTEVKEVQTYPKARKLQKIFSSGRLGDEVKENYFRAKIPKELEEPPQQEVVPNGRTTDPVQASRKVAAVGKDARMNGRGEFISADGTKVVKVNKDGEAIVKSVDPKTGHGFETKDYSNSPVALDLREKYAEASSVNDQKVENEDKRIADAKSTIKDLRNRSDGLTKEELKELDEAEKKLQEAEEAKAKIIAENVKAEQEFIDKLSKEIQQQAQRKEQQDKNVNLLLQQTGLYCLNPDEQKLILDLIGDPFVTKILTVQLNPLEVDFAEASFGTPGNVSKLEDFSNLSAFIRKCFTGDEKKSKNSLIYSGDITSGDIKLDNRKTLPDLRQMIMQNGVYSPLTGLNIEKVKTNLALDPNKKEKSQEA